MLPVKQRSSTFFRMNAFNVASPWSPAAAIASILPACPSATVERVVNDPEHNPYVAVLVHPAVNLSRLDDVLVITQTQNTMPATMQQDIATSEQKAADILAQRLPSVPPPATVGPDGKPINANSPPPPVRPPASLHPDQFTPDATPPASSLVSGGGLSQSGVPSATDTRDHGTRDDPSIRFEAR